MSNLIQNQHLKESENVNLPTKWGDFNFKCYTDAKTSKEHFVLSYGNLVSDIIPIVRVHSECATGDIFSSLKCDCGPQLNFAMKKIVDHGAGVLVYLKQEGRGIGIINKIKAYKLQEEGYDTVEANEKLGLAVDLRTYEVAAKALHDFGITKINLLSNNPAKKKGLEENGIEVAKMVSVITDFNKHNLKYIQIKKEKMNHQFDEHLHLS